MLLAILSMSTSCSTKLKYEPKAVKKIGDIETSISYPSRTYDCTLDPILKLTLNCTHFTLTVKNDSPEDYFIDWNRSYYTHNGESKGGFYFEGIVIKDRNNPKPDDVVLPNSSTTKEIYPNILTSFYSNQTFATARWDKKGFPLGKNGVFLTIKDSKDNKSVIKLDLDLSK